MNKDIHDWVLSEVTDHLNQKSYDIYTNPGEQKNAGIRDNYPDVIMTEKGTNTVKFIMEVETADSVTTDESVFQWKKFYTEIKATFYLIVPAEMLLKAKDLCNKVDVNARFVTYSILNDVITFDFK